VLVGWSGGGSLALFYQAQSEKPTITHTPAGDPYDLTAAGLPQADGVIFIAAHLSRAETLTEWLDPSVVDEFDPDRRDEEFDIYASGCPNKPPFTDAFVQRFRARQLERNRSITGWVRDTLDFLARRNDAEVERAFVTHRTMCDVRWIDPHIDPNGRKPNWCYMGDPKTVNVGRLDSRVSQRCVRGSRSGPTMTRTPKADERGQRSSRAGAADRKPGRRRGAGDAQPDHSRCAGDEPIKSS